ncbi:hypothetical protein HGRIS_002772 [Hohenbuehelia grisea]|uniref:Rpr2-domain-containing protein n=1 Tax=Hohenbuehelia grisea TaxID=104357 RepID=A0ABR3JLH9_9AGAR
MAKKGKDNTPNPNSVANRDILQRLNFLYQASAYLNSIPVQPQIVHPSEQSTEGNTPDANARSRPRKRLSAADLSRSYIRSMKIVGQKSVVKLDPSVKRTICKQCNTVLVPGHNVSVRVKKSPCHDHVMIYTCNHCQSIRRIPAPPVLVAESDQPLLNARPIEGVSLEAMDAMDTDATPNPSAAQVNASGPQGRGKKRKRSKARNPPLFARSAGHVVFRGNEKLPDDEGAGSGMYNS